MSLCDFKVARQQQRRVLDDSAESQVIVEVKSVESNHEIHAAQVPTYLRLTQTELALVINFGERYVNDGLHRVVHEF